MFCRIRNAPMDMPDMPVLDGKMAVASNIADKRKATENISNEKKKARANSPGFKIQLNQENLPKTTTNPTTNGAMKNPTAKGMMRKPTTKGTTTNPKTKRTTTNAKKEQIS